MKDNFSFISPHVRLFKTSPRAVDMTLHFTCWKKLEWNLKNSENSQQSIHQAQLRDEIVKNFIIYHLTDKLCSKNQHHIHTDTR